MAKPIDSLTAMRPLRVDGMSYAMMSLAAAEANGLSGLTRLPRSLKVLAENVLRHEDGRAVTAATLDGLRLWSTAEGIGAEVPFHPTRLVLNDSGGLPAMADLAALRDAVRRAGGDPTRINPGVPADMVIDHSVMVDAFGTPDAVARNLDLEYQRNGERYAFLRWCEQAFSGFRVAAPGQGILHQVNVEHMARCVWTTEHGGMRWAFPESLMGTDSHTPMVNALGVLGWGVGGIEATAGVLGQPIGIVLPRVVGCRLVGAPAKGVTATDITLLVVQRLRAYGVIAAYVEFFGPALSRLSLPDRATLSNMAPEYGATMGFCPVDAETIRFLELTGRGGAHGRLVEAYCRAQGLWHEADGPQPDFLETIEIDLSDAEPAAAGPRRPQDRVALPQIRSSFEAAFPPRETVPDGGLPDGAVVIAAITSCTNTSNPDGMLGAGILARKAAARGLGTKPWVKTSLAPGSTVVAEYLEATGLQEHLDQLGFNLIGFGCTTCMGNSGPLPEAVEQAIRVGGSIAVAVLSGNRNFEGRVHTLAKANYIMSPALVVAHALAGTIRIDLTRDPIGMDGDGRLVMLSDIWPTPAEIAEARETALTTERFVRRYGAVFAGDDRWRSVEAPGGDTFPWSRNSLYMQEPPFLLDVPAEPEPAEDLRGARMLVMLGDSVTTDHISPVGTITPDSASGRYLVDHQVRPRDFNSFAARRLNHHVMIRGTFGNIRLRNRLVAGTEGGWTRHQPSGEVLPIHEAADRYRAEGVPLIVVAGSEYGTGSSRDWAAKGTRLLGVRVVIAGSFERIHRSNLVYLGVLPLQLPQGVTPETLRLDGTETFDVSGIAPTPAPASSMALTIHRADGSSETVTLLCRLDTAFEAECFRHGGILPRVLRQHLAGLRQGA